MHSTSILTSAPNMRDKALQLASEGFPVFPLQAGAKIPPAGSVGHLGATTDAELIRELWSDTLTGSAMDYNIGIRPVAGEFCVIDLDEKDSREGIKHYEALGGVVRGRVVRTPSGGVHLYLAGADIATTAGRLAPGADSRGSSGYVVAPGSVIDGRTYELIEDGQMLPVPQFILDALPARADRSAAMVTRYAIESDSPENVARAVEVAGRADPAVSGCWHDYGFKLGAEMCRIGLSAEMAVAVLAEHWVPRGTGFKSQAQFEADVTGGWAASDQAGEHGAHSRERQIAALRSVTITPAPDVTAPGPLATAGPPASRLRLVPQTECKLAPRRQYVVKGLIAAGDVAICLGKPGAGKSAFVPLLSQCIASGVPAFGRKTRQGTVLYIPCEDPHGLKGRVQALGERHGDTADFIVVDGVTDLFSDEAQKADLLRTVRIVRPAVVVLDTLAAGHPGMRENDSEDMSRVLAYTRQLATNGDGSPGPAVILCHHIPKNGETPRGHGSLDGAADMVVLLQRDEDTGLVVARLTKNRNGPAFGVEIAFTIESAVIGRDEDGDDITAAIAVEADAETRRFGKVKLTPTEAKALGFLHDLLNEGGFAVHRGDISGGGYGMEPSGEVTYTDADHWLTTCYQRGLAASTNPRSQTQAGRRALEGLLEKRAIARVGSFVWPLKPAMT